MAHYEICCLLKPWGLESGDNADVSHKSEACVQDLANVYVPACCRVLVLIHTLSAPEDEASALLLRLPLACNTGNPAKEHGMTAAEHSTLQLLLFCRTVTQCAP